MEELKKCPFCGGDAEIHFIRSRVVVGCKTNLCMGQWWYTRAYNQPDQAVEAWNRRVDDE